MAGLVTQNGAARLTGKSVCQIRVWERQGRLEPRGRDGEGLRAPILYAADDVMAVAAWAGASVSENEAAGILGVREMGIQRLREGGDLGEWREIAGRREYHGPTVRAYAEWRRTLISMREAKRRYGLPYWVLQPLVDSGVIPATPGAKGSYLIDPLNLKPLLDVEAFCEGCGQPVPPGRTLHPQCGPKRPEARARNRQRHTEWWKSPEADAFRAKLMEMPCPACGKPVRLKAAEWRARTTRNGGVVFCNQSCAATYRFRKTGKGLESLAEKLHPRARQKVMGRWNVRLAAKRGKRPGPKSTLNVQQVIEIVERRARNEPRWFIAEKMGVSSRQIERVDRDTKAGKEPYEIAD